MNIQLSKTQRIIIVVNIGILLFFSFLMLGRRDVMLFVSYTLLILTVGVIILLSLTKVRYTNGVLWGFSFWSLLHFAGGAVTVGATRLYDLILIPLTADILRYDQLVHAIGFGFATLLAYQVLSLVIAKPHTSVFIVCLIAGLAGLGIGAINEIVEFIASSLVRGFQIGDRLNTQLDLVADLVGTLVAVTYIFFRERKLQRERVDLYR